MVDFHPDGEAPEPHASAWGYYGSTRQPQADAWGSGANKLSGHGISVLAQTYDSMSKRRACVGFPVACVRLLYDNLYLVYDVRSE